MHISSLNIQNFRCFQNKSFEFRPGLNVIIGENNSGKTALLTALQLMLNSASVSISAHDVHHKTLETSEPPRIMIKMGIEVDEKDAPEDKAAVASWLTRFEYPWEAQLSFVFELPDEYHERYARLREEISGSNIEKSLHAFEILHDEGRFLSRYFGGATENRYKAEPELRQHFQCRYLDAIRNAEDDLHSGRAHLLRKMLRRVLDSPPHPEDLPQKRQQFRSSGDELLDNLKGRLDHSKLFGLASEVWGEGISGEPQLFGRLSEKDVMHALALFLEQDVHRHPVSHNGLGYNNLLYVALVLASLGITSETRAEADFPVLILEEPEAHLHPALQYRFLIFLQEQLDPDPETGHQQSRQVFLSSHSTQVTSAVGLDALVCLYLDDENIPQVAYPGRSFPDTRDGRRSKAYVERFLDSTKSSLLFAKGVLLVEGIAEQVLIPPLADLAFGERRSWLDRNYVAFLRVDGLTFKHFLPLFGLTEDADCAERGLRNRPVACITDGDPLLQPADGNGRPRKCWPYQEPGPITPSATALSLKDLEKKFSDRLHVGLAEKTFEYDLALANPTVSLLVTEGAPKPKREALQRLMSGLGEPLDEPWRGWWPDDVSVLESCSSGVDDEVIQRRAVATYYLLCHKNNKGEHASYLTAALEEEISKSPSERVQVTLPCYIEKALRHVFTLEFPPSR